MVLYALSSNFPTGKFNEEEKESGKGAQCTVARSNDWDWPTVTLISSAEGMEERHPCARLPSSIVIVMEVGSSLLCDWARRLRYSADVFTMRGEATEWHRARWLSSAGKGRETGWKRDVERHFPAKSSQSRARGAHATNRQSHVVIVHESSRPWKSRWKIKQSYRRVASKSCAGPTIKKLARACRRAPLKRILLKRF